jgi:hypothetical protein
VLGEACPVNQRGDDDDAAADPKYSGGDAPEDSDLNKREPRPHVLNLLFPQPFLPFYREILRIKRRKR